MTPPRDFQACLTEGRRLLDAGQAAAAIPHYLEANALEPQNSRAALGLGMALSLAGRHEEARITLEHALTLAPHDINYVFALAEAHRRAGHAGTAEKLYGHVLAHEAGHLLAAHNLGSLLYDQDRFLEAAERHLTTVNAHPESVTTWRDLGQSLIAGGQLADGIAVLEAAREAFPDDRETRFALGLAYLRNEDWPAGWPLYEARWHPGEQRAMAPGSSLWLGEYLAGKHLLVTREQGFGDNLMFVRYLPVVAGEAQQITLLAPPPLATLFADSFAALGNVTVISDVAALPSADYTCPIGSLPLHCLPRGITAPPARFPYLTAAGEMTPTPGIIGIVWRGNIKESSLSWRSCSLDTFLSRLSPGNYVSLQIDATSQERRQLEAAGIPDGAAEIAGFHDSARRLQALSGLISIDTAMVHLAGALGVPATVLLRPAGDWRWGRQQDAAAWYPTLTTRPLG